MCIMETGHHTGRRWPSCPPYVLTWWGQQVPGVTLNKDADSIMGHPYTPSNPDHFPATLSSVPSHGERPQSVYLEDTHVLSLTASTWSPQVPGAPLLCGPVHSQCSDLRGPRRPR